MEPDSLKSVWQGLNPEPKSNAELQSMMKERRHPVLKGIRIQLIIEIAAYTVFLFVYHDIFDGDRKPLYVNILLAAAALLLIMLSIIGYSLTRSSIEGNNLKQSLDAHLFKMKIYAVVCVASRMLWAICLLLFFVSAIHLDAKKYWILACATGVFTVQLIILSRIWTGRIRQMKRTISSFFS